MIYESSKDYATGRVLILWGEEPPTVKEIESYVKTNYGIVAGEIHIDKPSMFRGMMNPGTITVVPNKTEAARAELLTLLEMAAPFVFAVAEESHRLHGSERLPIDELVERIRAAIGGVKL